MEGIIVKVADAVERWPEFAEVAEVSREKTSQQPNPNKSEFLNGWISALQANFYYKKQERLNSEKT